MLIRVKDWREKVQKYGQGLLHRSFSSRDLSLLFLVAVLCGIALKSQVNDRWTIGYDDYRLTSPERLVDLNVLQKELISRGGSLAVRSEQRVPTGASCGLDVK